MPTPLQTIKPVEVHGHRGCRGLRPENTLPAFLYALALGVDVVEMDVVISADKQVVVSHEPWLNPHICLDAHGLRIPPAAAHEFNLYQMPYAEIRRCDCGQLQHPGFPEQLAVPSYKPLLSEVLTTLEAAALRLKRPAIGYSIELKSSLAGDDIFHPAPADFLPLVFAELAAAQVLARTTLLSFDVRMLQLVHAQHPKLATCLLLEKETPWASTLHELGFAPTTLGPDFITVNKISVRELRDNFPGVRLVPWTVNELPDMRRLIALGVDGITTDYPDRLLALLQQQAKAAGI